MNGLQAFMVTGNQQSKDAVMEEVSIGGEIIYGTFGDPQLMSVMTMNGYQDHLVTPFKALGAQFADHPAARQTLIRTQTNREFFIQIVDFTNPVVYTFILTDREL